MSAEVENPRLKKRRVYPFLVYDIPSGIDLDASAYIPADDEKDDELIARIAVEELRDACQRIGERLRQERPKPGENYPPYPEN